MIAGQTTERLFLRSKLMDSRLEKDLKDLFEYHGYGLVSFNEDMSCDYGYTHHIGTRVPLMYVESEHTTLTIEAQKTHIPGSKTKTI